MRWAPLLVLVAAAAGCIEPHHSVTYGGATVAFAEYWGPDDSAPFAAWLNDTLASSGLVTRVNVTGDHVSVAMFDWTLHASDDGNISAHVRASEWLGSRRLEQFEASVVVSNATSHATMDCRTPKLFNSIPYVVETPSSRAALASDDARMADAKEKVRASLVGLFPGMVWGPAQPRPAPCG